jgi:hypothetical protein
MRHVVCAVAIVILLGDGGRAFAQVDLVGQWRATLHEDITHRLDEASAAQGIAGAGGPWIGDYTGLPINDAARFKAESWDSRIWNSPEHQTILQPGAYWILSPGPVRISTSVDAATQKLISVDIFRTGLAGNTFRTIWMDGRAHPPSYAAHTWQGFSTGVWNGAMLTVTTTHLKAGFIRRNGAPASDRATVTEHVFRHGPFLTVTRILEDPVYLEEPFVSSVSYIHDPQMQIVPPPPSTIVDEIPGQPKVFVPHFLPGSNTQLKEFAEKFRIPYEATQGGKETLYPEYQTRIRN